MREDQPSVDLDAKLQQLERELVGVREVLARIDAALAGIDPEDLDRLTDEGGRRAIMAAREREIEEELAALRAGPGMAPPILGCTPVVTGATLYSIALIPDGSAILTGGSDGLMLRHAATGATLRKYELSGGRLSVAVSPDGRYVAGRSYDDDAIVFDRKTGQRHRHFPDARTQANVAFTKEKYLAAVREGSRKQVTFDRVSGVGQRVIGAGFNEEIVLLAFPDHGRAMLAIGGPRCLLFGMGDGAPNDCPNIGGGPITAAAFAPGGVHTLLGHTYGQLGLGVLEEPDTDRFKFKLTHLIPSGERGRVFDVDFSPNARLFAVRRAGSVELFSREDGHAPVIIATYTGVGSVDPVARRSLLFAPDGQSFLTAGYQGLFRGDTSSFS